MTGTDTLFVRAADNLALTVTGCPSSTGLGEAERLTVGAGGWRSVKVSLAMRTLENLPVPLMLVIVPCGLVAGLLSENSVPSSVPASYGKRSTSIEVLHSSDPSSNDSPDIPTNQSGLGPIMDRSVTRGCDLLAVMENDAVPVPPPLTPCSITFSVCALASTSLLNVPVEPNSATSSTPALAVPPLCQKVTPLPWTPPISVVKCAPPTTPPGVLAVVQLP